VVAETIDLGNGAGRNPWDQLVADEQVVELPAAACTVPPGRLENVPVREARLEPYAAL
jgi:hypothetical protein